jgi:hypothetical protein
MPPNYWLQFVEFHYLIGKSVRLGEDKDLSALSADMQFLTVEQSIDELTNFWPGIGVAKDGYIHLSLGAPLAAVTTTTSIQTMGQTGLSTVYTTTALDPKATMP